MSNEQGCKWWFRYVLVPLVGGGGIVAVIVALIPYVFPPPRPATVPLVQSQSVVTVLKVSSGRNYFTGKLNVGSNVYTDRDYVYAQVPAFLQGQTYIITANDDKFNSDTSFLWIRAEQEISVYVAHSDRYKNKPAWLADFRDTGAELIFMVEKEALTLSLYEKRFSAGQIVLGGNIRPSEKENHAMYTVVISAR